jgi:hypothetical protein
MVMGLYLRVNYARNQVKGLADGEPQGTRIILNLETTLYG